jgi:hypothetical protein
MKKLFLIILVITAAMGHSAAQSPARFSYQVKKTDALHYTVTIRVSISSPWHIYSQDAAAPVIPTTITFGKNPLVEMKNKPVEKGNLIAKHDPVFDATLKYYNDEVEYVQDIVLKSPVKTTVTGSVEYMLCTDEQCIKPGPEQFKLMLE